MDNEQLDKEQERQDSGQQRLYSAHIQYIVSWDVRAGTSSVCGKSEQ
jgi:hypothetical protein